MDILIYFGLLVHSTTYGLHFDWACDNTSSPNSCFLYLDIYIVCIKDDLADVKLRIVIFSVLKLYIMQKSKTTLKNREMHSTTYKLHRMNLYRKYHRR